MNGNMRERALQLLSKIETAPASSLSGRYSPKMKGPVDGNASDLSLSGRHFSILKEPVDEKAPASPLSGRYSPKLKEPGDGKSPASSLSGRYSPKSKEPVDKDSENYAESAQSSTDNTELLNFLQQYQENRDAEIIRKNEEIVANALKSKKSNQKLFRKYDVPSEIKQQKRSLPIYSKKYELIKLIKNNQIVIVVGETGSGKSTQIPQYIADAGVITDGGMIGITQPRRVAAKSLAERVAVECGVDLGTFVGFAVRFESCVSSSTVIKYMTDGLLVKDCTQDEPNLDSYSVIMIDEAHERSIHTDVGFGLLKRAARNRPDLKIIISSATLEVAKFSKFFNDAPVFSVTGNGYDVRLIYEPSYNYLEDVVYAILEIHKESEGTEGDILVFLTGQDDIENVWENLEYNFIEQYDLPLTIVPCYGALPFEVQQKIFEKTTAGFRKVVLATNIAETSITIDGIVSVIDCGYVKERRHNPSTKIETLVKIPITKFQAIQRQGRAGRTQSGQCYRLYSEETYKAFREAQEPDIQRSNVESVVLDLLAMGIENPLKFEFVDAPSGIAIGEALIGLKELSALDDSLILTDLGRQMAKYPLDPPLAKVLITSAELGCSTEILKIVSVLSTQHQQLFLRDKKNSTAINKVKEVFHQPNGDHLTFLEIYDEWTKNKCTEDWCTKNFIQYRHLAEAKEIKRQLKGIMKMNKLLTPKGHDIFTCNPSDVKENICKAFTAGYFFHLGKKSAKGYSYQKLSSSGEQKDVFLHPSSALFKKKPLPEWIIFNEVMETSKAFVIGVIVIQPHWLWQYAPEFVKQIEGKYSIKI